MYLQKTFELKLYDCRVQIIVSKSATQTVNKLYKKYNTGMTYTDCIAGMMVTVSMNKYYLVVDEKHLTYNTICHELYHLTQGITYDRNIFEEEPRAWLQGILAQEIFDFLKKKKVNIG